MVSHHHHGVMSEGVSLQQLPDALVVGSHAAADERDGACRNIVASLQSPFTTDAQYGVQSQMLVAHLDDVGLRCALAAVHVADDMPSWSRDALVARKVEVHQRVLNVLRLKPRIIVGLDQFYRRLQQQTAYQVGPAHLLQHLLSVRLRLYWVLVRHAADVIFKHLFGCFPQFVDIHLVENAEHGVHLYAVSLQHLDIVLMLSGSLVHVKIVLKQSCRWVNHAVKQFLSRCMHQYVASLAPFCLWINHLLRPCVHSSDGYTNTNK